MGIGDEIMVSGEVKRRAGTQHKVFAIWDRRVDRQRWHDIWNFNPRIATIGARHHDRIYNHGGARPYIADKLADRWQWKSYGPEPGEIFLLGPEKSFAQHTRDHVVIHVDLKDGASPNKAWGIERWQSLISANPQVPWMQIGTNSSRRLDGVKFLVTPSFRAACGAVSGARAAVLQEGGLHHAAAAFNVRSVVIFGGFISPESTGYKLHTNLFRATREHPLGCGMRVRCQHCEDAMKTITPDLVKTELEKLL